MPMFTRKRASSQPPQHIAPMSSSATIAASAAFLNKPPSTTALSSAAAAAALRSHTTSPEPIANIQTKRMVRRGSQSSIGSGVIMGTPRNTIPRQASISSMTDRTFRSPSPGGARRPMSPALDTPPVPAIPKTMVRTQWRSASVDVPTRITSPSPRAGMRNTSVERTTRKLNLPPMPGLQRAESNQSLNYSRPMSPSRAAPPPRPHSSVGWFTTPQSSAATPRNSAPLGRPQSAINLPSPSAKSTLVKKNLNLASGAAPLANGGVQTPTTAPGPVPFQPVQPEATTPKKKKKKRTTVNTQASDVPVKPSPNTLAPPSPNTPRSAGLLQKQPSVVREDPQAEATAEVLSTPTKSNVRTIITSEGPVEAYVAPGATTRQRAASLDVPRVNGTRSGSLSPSRIVHAHFVQGSALATPLNVRHYPPPRSVSPMKSALRQSPASSVRDISPNTRVNSPKAPPSDTSDTRSMTSQDGIKAAKRKKSVRISEDGSTPVSPAVDPNARRELSGSWATEDINEILKPRSALPSFSSVRGRKQEQVELPEKVTETVSSSMTNSASTLPDRREVSNDHAVGAVLAQDYAQKDRKTAVQAIDPNEPLPPQVSSKESSAEISDSSYSEDEAESHVQLPGGNVTTSEKELSPVSEPKTTEQEVEAPEKSPIELAVPGIAVQPATPGIDEDMEPPLDAALAQTMRRPELKQRNSMPGAWDEPEEAKLSRQAARDEAMLSETDSSEDEAEFQPAQAGDHSPLLHPIYESDSDNEEAFSDAAEDPSEFDNGGFASLNAIVESPVSKPKTVVPNSPRVALSPSKATMIDEKSLTAEQLMTADTDWNSATAYWSSLSRTKRLELEAEAEAAIEAPLADTAPASKKKKQSIHKLDITDPTNFAPAPVETRGDALEAESESEVRKPALRKSMRDSGESERTSSETRMRKSMRASTGPAQSNETHMRTSMRAGGSTRGDGSAKSTSKKTKTPASAASIVPGAAAAALVAGAQSSSAKKSTKPTAAAAPAYDSDSESSFRKKRRGSVSTVDSAGKYTMKRSMRSSSVDAGPPPAARERARSPLTKAGSARFSLRSLSPVGSFRGRSDGEKLRESLRGAPADDTPTMRGKNSKASRDSKSSSGFSMSGFAKSKPSPAAAPKARSGGFKSRFVDSDDEDDAPRGGFRSRFADSDDEDGPVGASKQMPSNLAPVRGIPKRRGQDTDSTDLSDSEDEPRNTKNKDTKSARASSKPAVPSQSDIDAAMAAARRNVAAMNNGPTTVPESNKIEPPSFPSTLRQPEAPLTPTRKKGFLGSVLRRNSSSFTNTASPVDSQQPRSPSTLRNPKLQRRTTPQNWPLAASFPPPPPIPESVRRDSESREPRPTTSDGVPAMKRTMRPEHLNRSMSGNDLKTIPAVSNGVGQKKKKFSGLRKLFGLHD